MKNPFNGTKYENSCLSQIEFDHDQLIIIERFLRNPKKFLYLYSGTGVGKTHFCAAVTNMRINDQKKYCWYQSESDFFRNLSEKNNESYGTDSEINKMVQQEFLILDDLGSLSHSDPSKRDWHRKCLFTLIDGAGIRGTPMIITSNLSPEQLSSCFDERFISRIRASENIIIKLKGEDKRMIGL